MRYGYLAVALMAVLLCGCSGKSGDTATPEEKANIDRFVKEGIKEGDMGGANPNQPKPEVPKGQPGNQPVDTP